MMEEEDTVINMNGKRPRAPTSDEDDKRLSKRMKVNEDEEEVFAVEKIVQKRVVDGRTEYLLKWEGYDSSENTWEEECNISEEVIEAFNRGELDGFEGEEGEDEEVEEEEEEGEEGEDGEEGEEGEEEILYEDDGEGDIEEGAEDEAGDGGGKEDPGEGQGANATIEAEPEAREVVERGEGAGSGDGDAMDEEAAHDVQAVSNEGNDVELDEVFEDALEGDEEDGGDYDGEYGGEDGEDDWMGIDHSVAGEAPARDRNAEDERASTGGKRLPSLSTEAKEKDYVLVRPDVENIEYEMYVVDPESTSASAESAQSIPTFATHKAERILGVRKVVVPSDAEDPVRYYFFIKWLGTECATFVKREEANLRVPQLVIRFYEERLRFE